MSGSTDPDPHTTTLVAGLLGTPNMVPYSATKFAMTGFMEGLHYELMSRGVVRFFLLGGGGGGKVNGGFSGATGVEKKRRGGGSLCKGA